MGTQTIRITEEQKAIIHSNGNCTINAVAGSGKTSTLIEYAASRPPTSKLLYLAFNKSVRLEAQRKFAGKGLGHVKVETAHSLAYKQIVFNKGYKVRPQGYKIHEIADLLGLKGTGEKHTEYIIAHHISSFITYFCNSDKQKVQDLNYLHTISDAKAISFVQTHYRYIQEGTRLLLSKMDKAEIEITHDFYLKKFQLSKPVLPYDYILFDEGQDASSAMLDVFLNQKATKVIVGDTNQQIYGWRYAVNSLEKTDFPRFQLSASFRFQEPIARLANEILKWKMHLGKSQAIDITGKGTTKTETSKATIARTNLGLLLNAIEFITDHPKVKHLYFEGNINSYTYAAEGASLYDVLNLYNNHHQQIRDKLIRSMNGMEDLEEYIEKTEDIQLGMMVQLVQEYGNEIPGILNRLKGLHTGDEDRNKAEMIFSTVHRAKGMEYDVVYLVDDFIKESDLTKLKTSNEKELVDIAKLNEEINLLYVAITRTKNKLHIPDTLLPKNFPASPLINVIKTDTEEKIFPAASADKMAAGKPGKPGAQSIRQIKEKAWSMADKRQKHKDAYKPWSAELDAELKTLYDGDNPLSAIANHFGRTRGAILSRLKKLDYLRD